ncbi:MAG: sensor histidine kinase, partial [Phenylobacterium sp.]|nr:sensor histidine kinase [Phenylobacterium sp.]
NAVKHGALSNPGGHVAVTWRCETGDAGPRLALEWRESGGPLVTPPTQKGFGSRLIEGGLATDLGGEVRVAYEPGGLVCHIQMPVGPQVDA